MAQVDDLWIVELERKVVPKRRRTGRILPRVIHPRQRGGAVGLRRSGQGLLPGVQQVEAVPEFMRIGVKLEAELVCGNASDARMKNGASLTLLPLLIKHDAVEV